MTVDEKLKKLRSKMQENNIDAYIIPSSDPHQSEYVADHWKSREWISGFTGSAGTVVISKDHAGLWTDSRYFLQAEDELKNSEFVLHKVIDRSYPNFLKYTADNFPKGSTIACDGSVFSFGQIKAFENAFSEKEIELVTNLDFISEIWLDRSTLPKDKVFDHDVIHAGKPREEKFKEVRKKLTKKGSDNYLISALDCLAWVLNLRGSDIEYNPVFLSFGILNKNEILLFIDENKIETQLKNDLSEANVIIKPYKEIYDYLKNLDAKTSIYLDTTTCNFNLYNSISGTIIEGNDIISELKTIKNTKEIENIKIAHISDGVALSRFYIWLENKLKSKTVTEYEAVKKLAFFRGQNTNYISESFGAIVGYKSNGAIIHYSPPSEGSSEIKAEGMLLIDSGGQYLNGTTDITRTTYFGVPSEEEKKNFTLVLKGHIALAMIKFPEGTNGYQLDTFARQYLWQEKLNYYHGTGHGVGFFLNVHEGPQGISSALAARSKEPILAGMLNSNEPGYYKDGHYGIRIENLIVTVEDGESEYGKFLKNETVTMFPMDTKLIDAKSLTLAEKEWLNNYQNEVYEKLSPYLSFTEKKWLMDKCRNI